MPVLMKVVESSGSCSSVGRSVLPRRRGSAETCSSRCTLSPAARAARSAYSRLAARSAIRSGTRYAKWAGSSRSQTHRRAAMCGFTQDDGYVRGVAPTHKCSSDPCRLLATSATSNLRRCVPKTYRYRYFANTVYVTVSRVNAYSGGVLARALPEGLRYLST
jgi:hypothetical protein